MSEPTAGKTVLITGASRGIGLATTQHFLTEVAEVAHLVLLARPSKEFDAAVAELSAAGPPGKTVTAYPVDVGERVELLDTLQQVMQRHQRVDILVNNAGFTAPAPIHEVNFADFERTMSVNLYAPFTAIQALLHLGNTFEVIVNIASTAGITGRSGWLTYSSSKAALIAMSQVLKEELAIYGTRVVCISPGRCATTLRRTLAPEEDPSTIMQPEHVAEVIAMVVTDVGRFIDSQNLVVRL